MNKKTNTRRALVLSVLSLLLCTSLLIGSTFAWFTDTASTSVNKIQSGTLMIDLVNGEGNSLDGQTLGFVKAADDTSEVNWWEPGCTYQLQTAKLVNKGTLAAKCVVTISAVNGPADAKADLASVIDVYIGDAKQGTLRELVNAGKAMGNEFTLLPGEGNAIDYGGVIKLHMQETAGNEYQGLMLDSIAITVQATQAAHEYDSFNNTYDENAEFSESNRIFHEEFAAAEVVTVTPENAETTFANIEDGKVYKLSAGTYSRLPGQLVAKSIALIADGEVKVDGNAEISNGHSGENSGSTLYIEGIDFTGMLTVRDVGKIVVVKDCSMNHIQLYGSDKNATAFVIDGNTIDGTTHTTGTLYGIYGTGIADDTVTITNNTIKNTTKHAIGINGTCGEVTISGNTFDNFGTDGDNRSAFHTWNNDKYSNGTTPAVNDTLPEISTALAAAIKSNNTFLNWKTTNAYASFGNVRFTESTT